MADPNIGQAVAAEYERVYPKTPTDNIFNSNATFLALGPKGFKVAASGGRLFEAPVEYAVNTNMQMVRPDDELPTNRISVFDAARYDPKIAAGTVAYNYLQMLQNQGDTQKFDLIEGLIENGRKSLLSLLNQESWNTSTPTTNQLTSIPTIIASAPTTGTVGGINAATFTWWRNRQNSGAKTTTQFDNLQSASRTTWEQCSLGGIDKTPTAMVSDLTTFAGFEGTMVTLLRYFTDDLRKKGDPGFLTRAINFKETPYFYDEDAPAAALYFLNNDVLKFEYYTNAWMKLDPAVDPANQLANVHKLYTVGNYICAARRHLGVVTATTS